MQEKESAQREILFKARRVDNGEWVYGYYVYCTDGDKLSNRIYCSFAESYGKETLYPLWFEVVYETICQYTGLIDKNGVKIFDGDIVKWGHVDGYHEHPIRIAIVQINPDIQFDTGFTIFHYGSFAYADKTDKALEVIGSIHTTPELIGERTETPNADPLEAGTRRGEG